MSKVVWLPGVKMLKFSILLVVMTAVFLQTIPAYCGVSRTTSFQISVTIPPHVIVNDITTAQFSNNPYQLVQTQMVTRDNKNISLTSIVVP